MQIDHSNFAHPRQNIPERLPCPVHGGVGLNVSVWTDERGHLRAKCWSHNCHPREILRALGETPLAERPVTPKLPPTEAERMERARRIWSEATSAAGTLVEDYLLVRGINIPPPPSLRYDPRAWHPTGVVVTAMVAAITREKEIVGIQRTFLRLDQFGKAALQPAKIIIGIMRGGCVRLAPAAETIVLAEGVETALSVQEATGIPAWTTLGASNLASVILPEIVSEVIIAADHDVSGVGLQAAYRAADRFIAQSRTVRIALPPEAGKDFNDILLEGGAA